MSASTPIVPREISQRLRNHSTASIKPTPIAASPRPTAVLVLVAHRAVDDGLGHQWDRHGGHQADRIATVSMAVHRTR